jgi:D-alanine transaminase
MGRIAYVNGRFVPHGQAMVHIEDRGYQFADGVYEVCAIRAGRFLDEDAHWRRLARSLGELAIESPISDAALRLVSRELLRRNRLRDALLYLQVTRGVAPREHTFPANARPSLVMTVKSVDPLGAEERALVGIAVKSFPDLRWKRCDIKTVALLPNILAKQAAKAAGAFEALLVDEAGYVTEGASSNVWIVTPDRRLVTRQLDAAILAGVTRQTVLALAAEQRLALEERPFTVAEAKAAHEAFITNASSFVMPVTEIDGSPVGNGHPGEVASALRAAYLERAGGPGAPVAAPLGSSR